MKQAATKTEPSTAHYETLQKQLQEVMLAYNISELVPDTSSSQGSTEGDKGVEATGTGVRGGAGIPSVFGWCPVRAGKRDASRPPWPAC